jgi:hypothetical protein
MHRMRGTLSAGLVLGIVVAAVGVPTLARQAGAPPDRRPAPRLFQEFEGTWVLDEQSSTGRISATPGATVAFIITPTEITLTRTRKLPEQRSNPPSNLPSVHVFKVDGTETSTDTPYPYPRGRFQLVSDALVFTTSTPQRPDGVDMMTDAYSIEGDRLIARRQIVAVRAPGFIAAMQEPTNNRFHQYVYRRAAPAVGQ